jgi:hypothetical protein
MQGLRTLVFASRPLTDEAALAEWLCRWDAASAAAQPATAAAPAGQAPPGGSAGGPGPADLLEHLAVELEAGLQLAGVAGVEDQLQAGGGGEGRRGGSRLC